MSACFAKLIKEAEMRVTRLEFRRCKVCQKFLCICTDPRDPDPSRQGMFRYHNCAYCRDGELPCRQGHPHRCEYPRARND